MNANPYFMEIAIYRIAADRLESDYRAAWARKRARINAPLSRKLSGELAELMENAFWREYGMPWRYNQTIGWIRLYSFGGQVRGELWLHEAKRYQRVMGRRYFQQQGKAFECHVYPEESDTTIIGRLRDELMSFPRQCGNARFVLDLQCFDELASFIDWHRLLWTQA